MAGCETGMDFFFYCILFLLLGANLEGLDDRMGTEASKSVYCEDFEACL